MAYKRPFILLCVPQSLDYLRDLGYQTFHPFINESYDTEKDDGKRLLMILDEVSRLCYLKEQELQQFLSDVEPICEHNFKVLERARDKAIV